MCVLNKQHYYNTIGLQIEDLRTLVDVQTEMCFDRAKLGALLDASTVKGLKRVIITGCGDSFSAAGAMKPAFRLHSGLKLVSVPDPMEFCRYYSKEAINKGCLDSETLVIAVSASGGSARIVEILTKANDMGVGSMLISNNPESNGAKAAQYMYHVQTPPGCNSPGLRSYFASMVAITALGAWIGLQQGHITEARFDAIRESIVSYVKAVMACYDRIDDQMFRLGMIWKDYEKFEIVGDWGEAFSAQFVEEKFIECAGVHTTHADSEDWCHINFFLRDPKTIGTVFMTHAGDPSFDRMCYTVRSAAGIGRPVLVVTDAEDSLFPETVEVCRIPAAPEGWMTPLTDFIPGSLLGAYVAACADKLFFGGKYDFRTQTWNWNA